MAEPLEFLPHLRMLAIQTAEASTIWGPFLMGTAIEKYTHAKDVYSTILYTSSGGVYMVLDP